MSVSTPFPIPHSPPFKGGEAAAQRRSGWFVTSSMSRRRRILIEMPAQHHAQASPKPGARSFSPPPPQNIVKFQVLEVPHEEDSCPDTPARRAFRIRSGEK